MELATYNPSNKPVSELPTIYGFNNGGSPGFYYAVLIADDGEVMGGHMCSHEGFMPGDLGVLEGSRPDRHETFKAKYPDGYQMAWVPTDQVQSHLGLSAACQKNSERAASQKAEA